MWSAYLGPSRSTSEETVGALSSAAILRETDFDMASAHACERAAHGGFAVIQLRQVMVQRLKLI